MKFGMTCSFPSPNGQQHRQHRQHHTDTVCRHVVVGGGNRRFSRHVIRSKSLNCPFPHRRKAVLRLCYSRASCEELRVRRATSKAMAISGQTWWPEQSARVDNGECTICSFTRMTYSIRAGRAARRRGQSFWSRANEWRLSSGLRRWDGSDAVLTRRVFSLRAVQLGGRRGKTRPLQQNCLDAVSSLCTQGTPKPGSINLAHHVLIGTSRLEASCVGRLRGILRLSMGSSTLSLLTSEQPAFKRCMPPSTRRQC
jgi:hypothetical protein